MIDHGALEAGLVDFLGELVDFFVGGVAEKESGIAVGSSGHIYVANFAYWLTDVRP
jgi:hypothetical protein